MSPSAPDLTLPLRASHYRRRVATEVDLQRRGHVRVHLALHLAVVFGIDVWVARSQVALSFPLLALLALTAGHSAMVCAFAAHELGHGAGTRSRISRRVWLLLGWAPSIFGVAAVQQRAHNLLHHRLENSPRDPDRRLTSDELHRARAERVAVWLFPNRRHPIVSGAIGFAMSVFAYHLSIFWHSVLATGELYDARLDRTGRRRAVLEGLFNGSLQVGLLVASGVPGKMLAFLAVQYFAAASGAGLYIATNHLLCGMNHETRRDPLASTLSLRVPRWVDALHLNFSHHVEHHVFPGASYAVLPDVRRVLEREFSERYRAVPWALAVRQLLSLPLCIADMNTLTDPDGRGAVQVPFPSRDHGPFIAP